MKNKSTILQMFYGNIGNYECIKNTPRVTELLEKVVVQDQLLREQLAKYPELLNSYEKTNDLIEQMHSENSNNFYVEGFKLGLLVGVEASEALD